jgi:hypothetical protein
VPSWEASFHELRDEFVASSRERLARMEALADALATDLGDQEARETLRRQFHGLAGSGTTYGFPRVTELGLAGELRLGPVEEGGAALLSGTDVSELRRLVDAVRVALDAGPQGD